MDKRLENQLFEDFYNAIIEYNKIHMLTGHTKREDAYERLFLDAVTSFEDIDLKNKSVLDVGTGAGLPGVPLKIVEPSIDLFLLETMTRRVKFLNTLKDINIDATIVHARAEEAWKDYKESMDIVTLRAVTEIRIALELVSQYCKIGGSIILVKGPKAKQEIEDAKNAATKLGLKYIKTIEKMLPCGITNYVVIYEKVKTTDEKYPRNFGRIKKKPL